MEECKMQMGARQKYDVSDLKINDILMANSNIENPRFRGYWYDVRIITVNIRRREKEIIGCLYIGRDAVPLDNCKIVFCDDILKIEKPIPVADRTKEDDSVFRL
jgi:hypothetical protein